MGSMFLFMNIWENLFSTSSLHIDCPTVSFPTARNAGSIADIAGGVCLSILDPVLVPFWVTLPSLQLLDWALVIVRDVDLTPLAKAVYVLSLTNVGLLAIFLSIPSNSLPFKDDNLPLFNRLSGRYAEGVGGDLGVGGWLAANKRDTLRIYYKLKWLKDLSSSYFYLRRRNTTKASSERDANVCSSWENYIIFKS